MNMQQRNQPLLNTSAYLRAVGMWTIIWGATVGLASYQGQPGILCLTPLAWLLAVPTGLNYVAFSAGRPGRSPFWAGAVAGATLGLLFGLLIWGLGGYLMPADPEEMGTLSIGQIGAILTGLGVVVGALLSGFTAARAAAQQRRGHTIASVSVQ
ncbi:MAG: hypothetical protein KDE31_07840 [Caldilineaceae bacterium]|nr:hypothetical protein [Caldilineaceae bacterium]